MKSGVLYDYTGKVVLITGAGGSIGSAYAKAFSDNGASIVAADIRYGNAQATINEIGNTENHMAVEVDVASIRSIEDMVEKVLNRFGKIDVLLNHAGLNIRKPAIEYSEEDWDKIDSVNLKGAFFVAQKIGMVMIKQNKGKIINTASVSSVRGHPRLSIYAATKGGIAQLTKVLAIEWAEHNINVNAIGPGYIRTEQTAKLLEDPENYKNIVSKIPMNRVGDPEDLVGAALFLASESSNYITGQTLFVEGGRLID